MVIARTFGRKFYRYLDDARAIYTEFTSLIRIAEEDFGKNKQEWSDWMNAIAADLKPVPMMVQNLHSFGFKK